MEMKSLLPIALSLSVVLALSACDSEVEEIVEVEEGDVVRVQGDPFSYHRYFDPPSAETISRWYYILRYTEKSHARTPLVVDCYYRGDVVKYVVRRISGLQIDLKYTREVKYSPELNGGAAFPPPDWAMNLAENDFFGGLDGTSTIVDLFYGEKTRSIIRWSPIIDGAGRGLKEFNAWVAQMKKITGIHARLFLLEDFEERSDDDDD